MNSHEKKYYFSRWNSCESISLFFFPLSLQATDFLFQVFAASVVSWGDHLMPLLYGVRAQWFPWEVNAKPQPLQHCLYGDESLADRALPQCLLGLPHSLARLLDKEPWSGQTQKVGVSTCLKQIILGCDSVSDECVFVSQFIDWLFSITEAPDHSVSTATISTAKGEEHNTHNSHRSRVDEHGSERPHRPKCLCCHRKLRQLHLLTKKNQIMWNTWN